MENKLLTYDEILKQTDKKRYLLLGNGFSMAYNKVYFGVSNLNKGQQELSDFIEKNNNLEKNNKQIFFYDYKSVKIWQKIKEINNA